MRIEYGPVLILAVFLVALSQALDGLQTPAGVFVRGVVVGLSIFCSMLGLVLCCRVIQEGAIEQPVTRSRVAGDLA